MDRRDEETENYNRAVGRAYLSHMFIKSHCNETDLIFLLLLEFQEMFWDSFRYLITAMGHH